MRAQNSHLSPQMSGSQVPGSSESPRKHVHHAGSVDCSKPQESPCDQDPQGAQWRWVLRPLLCQVWLVDVTSSITTELLRNAGLQAPPQTYRISLPLAGSLVILVHAEV